MNFLEIFFKNILEIFFKNFLENFFKNMLEVIYRVDHDGYYYEVMMINLGVCRYEDLTKINNLIILFL